MTRVTLILTRYCSVVGLQYQSCSLAVSVDVSSLPPPGQMLWIPGPPSQPGQTQDILHMQHAMPVQQNALAVQQNMVPVQQNRMPLQQNKVRVQQNMVPVLQKTVPG